MKGEAFCYKILQITQISNNDRNIGPKEPQ